MEPGIVHGIVVCVICTWIPELNIAALVAVQIASYSRILQIRTLVLSLVGTQTPYILRVQRSHNGDNLNG